ncbi:MFS general substrate transporter [Pleurostoma richardsiae]|uniref:MFS general substrate transporter n=1 Tax=Pleurostoma richardsiae TaxID=41990 RepID=A0AA38VDA6_9PEZI|nr:MFS general substrate transporter [Pleurostoma richardsiae]
MKETQDGEDMQTRDPLEFEIDSDRGSTGEDAEDAGLLEKEEERSRDSADEIGGDATSTVFDGVPGAERTQARDGLSLDTALQDQDLSKLEAKRKKQKPIGWKDLPRKKQLVVITLTRLSEPLVQTSLQAYMFYQLKWFDPSLPDSVIASQAGILHASFTAAQFLTAMMWGRIADSSKFGRKTVILIGLAGTMVSCLGFGFSTSFAQALFFRSLGGITNGNVGVMRTMINETIREKKYQSRAFLLLPMTFNCGVIIGPILGGILSDPAGSYPKLFGKVAFFIKFPYATPNLVSAFFLVSAGLAAWLCLEETLDSRRDRRDIGVELGAKIASVMRRCFSRDKSPVAYTPLASRDVSVDVELTSPITPTQQQNSHSRNISGISNASVQSTTTSKSASHRRRRYTQRLPFRRIFTRNVSLTLVAQFLMAFHIGTFNSLWFIFLSTPVYDPSAPPPPGSLTRHPPFVFTGGMGLPPRSVGMAMAILGVLGIALQLLLYPTLSARLGTVRSWRIFLLCFPVAYFLVPYLALVPSSASSPPPGPKGGAAAWVAIAGVLFIQVIGRTFALPAQTILINNCTPHPSVLGTVHGLGQSVSSAARTVGPMMCGFLYGLGLSKGIVGAVWWGLSAVATMGWLASWLVREGDGHEIWLEGDDEEEEEEERERAVGGGRP